MEPTRRGLPFLASCVAILLALSVPHAVNADPFPCAVHNGSFDQGELFWSNENSGPGVGSAVQEIVDIDGRTDVLHLDSRAGSNYYLFRTQTIDLADCGGIANQALAWDWRLDPIESPYGLAAMWLELFDDNGDRTGVILIRRHTGQFAPYDCSARETEFADMYPSQGLLCREQIGGTFDWTSTSVSFTQALFDQMVPTPPNPEEVVALRIIIESYNNAGAGVDAYFDDVHLEVPPLGVEEQTWGRIKSSYQ